METVAIVQLATSSCSGYEGPLSRMVGSLLAARLNRSDPIAASHVELHARGDDAAEVLPQPLVIGAQPQLEEVMEIARGFQVRYWLTGALDFDEQAGALALALELGPLTHDHQGRLRSGLADPWSGSFHGELDDIAQVMNRAAMAVVAHLAGDTACVDLAADLPVETRSFEAFKHFCAGATFTEVGDSLDELKSACRLDHYFVEAQGALALAALKKGRTEAFEEASTNLLLAAGLRPARVVEQIERLVEAGFPERGGVLAETALQLASNPRPLLVLLGQLALRRTDALGERAAAVFEGHDFDISHDAGLMAIYAALARSGGQVERSAEIAEHVAQLSHLAPGEGCYLLGSAAALAGHYPTAVQHLERALELEPDHTRARGDLAAAYMQLERFEQAASVLAKSTSDHVVIQSNLALALRHLGRMDEAEAAAQRAIDADPSHPQAWAIVGDLSRARGEFDKAQRAFEVAVRVDAANPYWHRELGRVLFHSGQMARALDEFRHVMALQPEFARITPEILFILAQAAELDGGVAEAETLLGNALELDPGLWQAANNLGVLLLRQGRKHEAARWFEQALEIVPDNDGVRMNLARARGE